MLRDGVAVGCITVTRPRRGGYTGAEISLLQTFANQAANAVENARLLREVEQRNASWRPAKSLRAKLSMALRRVESVGLRLGREIRRAVKLCRHGAVEIGREAVERLSGWRLGSTPRVFLAAQRLSSNPTCLAVAEPVASLQEAAS
jgi:GAF domain-containing protein